MPQNSRINNVQQSIRLFYGMAFWLPVILFSLLLVLNTIPYFSFNSEFSFIEERSMLFKSSLYKTSFYIHILAGAICILTALVQFSRIVLKKVRSIHIWSGRIYVFVVLFLGAPTGLYMSFFAKGSIWERILFMFMACFWFISTLKGLREILEKNILAHKNWMIRSYAMALTAVTFRVYHLVFYLMGWDHLKNYEISLWISVIGNLLVAEWIIFSKSKRYLKSISLKNHLNTSKN